MRSSTSLDRLQRIIARGIGQDVSVREIARQIQTEMDQQCLEDLYRRERMQRGAFVEILVGADKGRIAKIDRVDGFRVLTQIEGEALDHYRLGDLKLVHNQQERIMAEGECVKVLNGEHKDKTGVITLIERQDIFVSIEGVQDPVIFHRHDLEVVDCPEEPVSSS